jgi:hypothetical protein
MLLQVLGDLDDWYLDGKRSAAEINGTATPSLDRTKPDFLVKDLVSFHYVSEVEVGLLYDLLGGDAPGRSPLALQTVSKPSTRSAAVDRLQPICRKNRRTGKESLTAQSCSSAREIHALWPDSDERAGHYSRPLSKGPQGLHEVDLLYNYLSHVEIAKFSCMQN